ncbi:hypothetical protein ABIC47_000178 [Leifsonia sp. 563]|uniref:hypothetical protein n=1 Tax=Leifsonia sp. 563 TaxID=3156412 RepID=UPI0033956364
MTFNTATIPTVVTIKFEQLARQTAGGITRISGFLRARHFIAIIDALDLEANPRAARVGRVTNAIIESIQTTPKEFPFKTKGVLLGATEFDVLDRGRVKAVFTEPGKEGILDGGHNTMAIGIHILRAAGVPDAKVRKAKDWASFRALWLDEAEAVKTLRGEPSAFGQSESTEDGELAFLIPVELIVPSDPDDLAIVDAFQSSILEICAARNNNAELVVAGKSNQAGFYEDLKQLLPPKISARIEWKTGEGQPVKVSDLIAMSWIPLSLLEPMPTDEGVRPVVAPIPQNLYRNKGESLIKFDDLMRLEAVTFQADGKFELRNQRVRSALKVAAKMPEVFDLIEELFPDAYNKADGKYGRIGAVKKMNQSKSPKTSNFEGRPIPVASPDGFLYPVIYGVRELMIQTADGNIEWRVEPLSFVREHLVEIAEAYKAVVSALDWDPVRVGKAPLAYQVVATAYQAALANSGK